MSAGWIQTFSGVAFSIEHATPADIRLEDIAHALSHACRFTGHVSTFYSVAEHSVRLARLCSTDEIARAGLLHDATEAYLVDVPRPIKPFLKGYKEIEERIAGLIAERFNVQLCPLPKEVKHLDMVMLATEKRDLMGNPTDPRFAWEDMPSPLDERIAPWSCAKAKASFLNWARMLGLK